MLTQHRLIVLIQREGGDDPTAGNARRRDMAADCSGSNLNFINTSCSCMSRHSGASVRFAMPRTGIAATGTLRDRWQSVRARTSTALVHDTGCRLVHVPCGPLQLAPCIHSQGRVGGTHVVTEQWSHYYSLGQHSAALLVLLPRLHNRLHRRLE